MSYWANVADGGSILKKWLNVSNLSGCDSHAFSVLDSLYGMFGLGGRQITVEFDTLNLFSPANGHQCIILLIKTLTTAIAMYVHAYSADGAYLCIESDDFWVYPYPVNVSQWIITLTYTCIYRY